MEMNAGAASGGPGRFFTKPQIAQGLRISRSKVDELIAQGLPVVRLGHRTIRISEKALVEFLASRTKP